MLLTCTPLCVCPEHLFLIMGQSNAVGHGVSPSSVTPSGIMINELGVLSTDYNVNTETRVNVFGIGEVWTHGIERYLAECVQSSCTMVIKRAWPGSAIRGIIAGGNQSGLPSMLAAVRKFKASFPTCKPNVHLIWIHGGADANQTHAGDYQSQERVIFDAVQAEFANQNFAICNVLLQRVRPQNAGQFTIGQHTATVNQAKVDNAAFYQNYVVLDHNGMIPVSGTLTDGYDTHADNIHYNNNGLLQIAQEYCANLS